MKNGTPASPATARASSVFPVPGAPIIITPLGISAPISKNFFGFFKKSTISSSSCFASFAPATSLKVTLFAVSVGSIIRALDAPKLIACIPAPFTDRVKNQIITPKKIIGNKNGAKLPNQYPNPVSFCTSIFTCESCSGVTPKFASVSDTAVPVSFFASPMLRSSST